jgi:hypothetical protein
MIGYILLSMAYCSVGSIVSYFISPGGRSKPSKTVTFFWPIFLGMHLGMKAGYMFDVIIRKIFTKK